MNNTFLEINLSIYIYIYIWTSRVEVQATTIYRRVVVDPTRDKEDPPNKKIVEKNGA